MGGNPGEAAQSSSHGAGLVPSKRLANKPCPDVSGGFEVKKGQKIQVVGS